MINRLKTILTSIDLFSRLIIRIPLRPYQLEPANAVIQSCLHSQGSEFLWVFPRQSGKDETIAQLVVFLLTLFQRVDACIVHVYPTQQQIPIGTTRLQRRLDNLWTAGHWWTKAKPIRLGIGKAMCAFFSGHAQSRAEGATANLLLIVNETQDQDEAIVERRFTPMRASTNASALFVGTVRTTTDYLWRVKTRLEDLQARDGERRVFIVTADQVGQSNPHYADFVANQIRLKGRQHPTVKTELFNEPLDTAAGLFPPRRIALMQGTHERQRSPLPVYGEGRGGGIYIATLDVAGQDEGTTDGMFADLVNPARDYTVATIFQVIPPVYGGDTGGGDIGPTYHAVDVFVDHGTRHFQPAPGQPPLFDRLLAYLKHWQPIALIADASGVGQGITDALTKAWPRQIVAFDFAKGHAKAQLGNDFIALVETGRFKYWTDTPPSPLCGEEARGEVDSWWFFEQCRFCGYELAEGLPIERGLKWGVPGNATTQGPDGHTTLVHDDRLLSAALIAEADRRQRAGEIFIGTVESHVIQRPAPKPDKPRRKKEEWS